MGKQIINRRPSIKDRYETSQQLIKETILTDDFPSEEVDIVSAYERSTFLLVELPLFYRTRY